MLSIASDYVPYETNTPIYCYTHTVYSMDHKEPFKAPKRKQSMASASLTIGKASPYFSNLRRESADLYWYIHDLGDGDLVTGYAKYEKELLAAPKIFKKSKSIAKRLGTHEKFSFEYFNNRKKLNQIQKLLDLGGCKSFITLNNINDFYAFMLDKEREYEEGRARVKDNK